MFKATAVSYNHTPTTTPKVPTGRLLINDADELIYANTQARHFLGLLSEELLPAGQKLTPLLRETFQFYPQSAWVGWPKRPLSTAPRFLIYTSPRTNTHALFKVEIIEQIMLEGKTIWAIAIQLIESRRETAVS